MPTFEFSAVDRSGRTRTGALASPDGEAARRALERRGLVATQITVGAATRATQSGRPVRLGAGALALITRQIATLATVAPIEEALRSLAEQAKNRKQRELLSRVHSGVVEGQRLSDAMARLGPAFPATYRAMVAAGESSGSLPQVLERLADLLEKKQDMQAKVASALVYPIVLAVVALGVIVALMTFVVPRVVEQFDVSGQRLPALTNAMIAISNVMLHWGWAILLGIAAGLALLAWALSRPGPRLAFDGMLLKLPVVGRVIRNVESASLARSLATMIGSGLPVLEALNLAGKTAGNTVVRAATKDMASQVHEGVGLSSALRRAKVFPPLLVHLTASGENSGKLEPMLERAADYLERDVRTATSVALSLLEPAIIVIMGGIVCLVILSILLPILQINTLGV
jgi:general secretion pathway protein F